MPRSWIAPLAALLVAAAPLAEAETKDDAKSDAAAGFVQQALKSGEEAVALAKLAAEKSRDGEIKEFAQMLVSDHTAVNEQLALLAKRNGAAPAPRTGPKSESDTPAPPAGTSPGAAPSSPMAQELGRLTGAEFDKKFLALVVAGHEKSVELYNTEAETGSNPASKKLAGEMLPKIKQHLQQAKSLQQRTMDKKK